MWTADATLNCLETTSDRNISRTTDTWFIYLVTFTRILRSGLLSTVKRQCGAISHLVSHRTVRLIDFRHSQTSSTSELKKSIVRFSRLSHAYVECISVIFTIQPPGTTPQKNVTSEQAVNISSARFSIRSIFMRVLMRVRTLIWFTAVVKSLSRRANLLKWCTSKYAFMRRNLCDQWTRKLMHNNLSSPGFRTYSPKPFPELLFSCVIIATHNGDHWLKMFWMIMLITIIIYDNK